MVTRGCRIGLLALWVVSGVRIFRSGPPRILALVTLAALIAALPELMMTVCHIGNDSLAVALGGLFLLALLRWIEQPDSMRRAIALGTVLGLALLTKAYFLALVPPLFVFAAIRAMRKRVLGHVLALFGAAIVISGWWYLRNWVLTNSISGNQFEVAAARLDLLRAVRQVNWLQAADFTFLTHIWLGNWSFLVVRSWMYHFFALVAGLAGVGLIVRLLRRQSTDLWLLSGIYLSFLIALGYHAARAFHMESFPGALGYYLFAIVIAEVILAVTGLQAIDVSILVYNGDSQHNRIDLGRRVLSLSALSPQPLN
jgi:4-amino-4-deoxy-L-arabinose transferase-like glycosyltransferase